MAGRAAVAFTASAHTHTVYSVLTHVGTYGARSDCAAQLTGMLLAARGGSVRRLQHVRLLAVRNDDATAVRAQLVLVLPALQWSHQVYHQIGQEGIGVRRHHGSYDEMGVR